MSDGGRALSPNGAGSQRLRTSADFQSIRDCRSLITTGSPGACRFFFFPSSINLEVQHLLRFLMGCGSRMRAGFPQPRRGPSRAKQLCTCLGRGRPPRSDTHACVLWPCLATHACCSWPGLPSLLGLDLGWQRGFGMGWCTAPCPHAASVPPPSSAAEANEGKRKISVPEEEGSWVN